MSSQPRNVVVFSCLVLLVLLAGGAYGTWNHSQDQDQDSEDAVIMRNMMRSKLMYSQNIVEGLSLGRFDLIEAATDEIIRIGEAHNWIPDTEPELTKIRDEMGLVATRLKAAAEKRNLEGAAVRYFELTLKCIDCHQALRKTDF
ncbi:MAG: hypothetical protein KF851_17925 [Pirellulaceae bacterium]|jgi:hypothetical protein|nr:hypothetical protein [Pirellulaceae bacterium]